MAETTGTIVPVWERGRAEQDAKALFGNMALHRIAAAIGGCHPRALDYVRQAPVIVLAANAGLVGGRNARRAQAFAGPPMRMLAERGEKLREVMAFYGCGFHLRKLEASVLHPVRWPTIYHLGRLPPSTLSQIIPDTRRGQDVWLRSLVNWVKHVRRRCGNPWFLFDWAAATLRVVPRGQEALVTTVADLGIAAQLPAAIDAGVRFDPRWTFDQAHAAALRWHARMARRELERKAATDLGVEFALRVPYAPFPDEAIDFGTYDFVPLRSCEDLHIEGAAMRHCVASYSPDLIAGTTRIFSVQVAGRRVATAEYARRLPSLRFELVQLKGPCNAAPPAGARRAALLFGSAVQQTAFVGDGTGAAA